MQKEIIITTSLTAVVERTATLSISKEDWDKVLEEHKGDEESAASYLQKTNNCLNESLKITEEIDKSWSTVSIEDISAPENTYSGMTKPEIFWNLLKEEHEITVNGNSYTAYTLDDCGYDLCDVLDKDTPKDELILHFSTERIDGDYYEREILVSDIQGIDTVNGVRWTVGDKLFIFRELPEDERSMIEEAISQ